MPGFRASLAKVVVDYVLAAGRDAGAVLQVLGVRTVHELCDETRPRIPAKQLSLALAEAAAMFENEHVALEIAAMVRPAHMGALGYAVMSCQRGGDALSLLERLQSVLMTEIHGRYDIVGQQLRVRHEARATLPTDYGFWAFFVGCRLAFARWVSGIRLVPERIDLPCEQPADVGPLEAFLGAAVARFETPDCVECMPVGWLAFANPNADPATCGLMTQLTEREALLDGEEDRRLAGHIKQAVIKGLATDGTIPSLEAVIQELANAGLLPRAASVRKLQRKLFAMQCSFKGLVEEARREWVLEQLSLTDRPITQIAVDAGYAEASSFHRAIKRWTGTTASTFRALAMKGRGRAPMPAASMHAAA